MGEPNSGWKAWWGESDPNGSPIVSYELQVALQSEGQETYDNLTYNTVYNNSGMLIIPRCIYKASSLGIAKLH